MWGLLLLFFAAVYFSMAGLLLYKIKPYWGKALVLIASVLIPNADDWYYRHQLEEYCKEKAGFKIYQQASRKEGLLNQVANGFSPNLLVAYVEWPERTGKGDYIYWRADRLPDSSISRPNKIQQYTAQYEIVRIEKKIKPFIEVRQQVIQRSSRTIIGEFVGFYYYGGWYPGALVQGGGLVAACGRNGQLLSNRQWAQNSETSKGYDGNVTSEHELIARIFSK